MFFLLFLLLLPSHCEFVILGLLKLLIPYFCFLAILLPVTLEVLQYLILDSLEPFVFKFFKFILGFTNISCLNSFIYLLGSRDREHLIAAHITVAIADWVGKCAYWTGPFHESLIGLLLLFLLVLFLNLLDNLFLNKFSNVPSFHTDQ